MIMYIREELTDFCYRLILTITIALFLFLEIYNFYDPELITRKNIISVLLISLSFNVLLLIYHKIHLYIIPAIFLATAIFAFFINEDDVTLILKSVLFKLVIIGFAAFIIFLTSDTSVAVNLILSAGLILYMAILLIRDMDIYPASPAFAMFYIAFSITRFIRRKPINSGNIVSEDIPGTVALSPAARLRRYVTFIIPFLLVIPLVIFLLPKPETPISWDWAKRLYENAVDGINKLSHKLSLYLFSSEDEDGITVSFGYEDSMTYDNDDNDATVMELYTDSRIYGGSYLKGEIFNVFENGGWRNTLESSRDYSAIDAFETYYGVVNFDRECVNDILKRSDIKIRYLDLATRMLFVPSKILPINQIISGKSNINMGGYYTYKPEDKDDLIRNDNEHLLFSERKTYGTEYNLQYYQLNYGSRPFYDFMVSDLPENEDAFRVTKTSYLNFAYGDITLEEISEYRDYINRYYISKPQVRDSVKEWVETVTKDATSDYDKLKAIEYALSNYEYTLEGGELPDYVKSEGDFLNYFLIEKRSGYCVHYATAFCLLARYMGFPARVIQGYKTYVKSGETAYVISGDGHTWPEVYFPGKGWIAFEPTPGLEAWRYGSWKIYSGKYSEYQEKTDAYTPFYPDVPEVAEDEEYVKSHSESRVSGMLILIIVSIIVISLILLVVTSLILNYVKRRKLTSQKLYSVEFKNILAILKELKITRSKEETLEEFSGKCRDKLSELIKEADKDKSAKAKSDDKPVEDHKGINTIIPRYTSVVKTYEHYIYGNKDISDEELNEISGLKDKLLILMKRFYGATYLIHKMSLYIASSIRT